MSDIAVVAALIEDAVPEEVEKAVGKASLDLDAKLQRHEQQVAERQERAQRELEEQASRIPDMIEAASKAAAIPPAPPIVGPPGDPGLDGRDGEDGQGFRWRGRYDGRQTYEPYDVVQFEGSSYVTVTRIRGKRPDTGQPWELMAKRGEDGRSIFRLGGGGGSGGGGGGSALAVLDEGGNLDSAVVAIDFVGAGVTATETSDHHIEVNIPGGGAGTTNLYVQDSDPGAVGAGKLWLDTSGSQPPRNILVRNDTDDDWEDLLVDYLADNTGGAGILLRTENPDPTATGGSVQLRPGSGGVGGVVAFTGGNGAAGQIGGQVSIDSGTGDDGNQDGAEVLLHGGSTTAPGFLEIYTDGSTGTIGQVLTADGTGKAYWADLSASGAVGDPFTDTFDGDGIEDTFTLSHVPAFALVTVSGVTFAPGIDYVITTDQLVFTDPPPTGTDNIVVFAFQPSGASSGAPTDVPYYVTTASPDLSAEVVVPAFIQTLLDDTTQGAARATLGLVPGTDVEAHDADLTTIAGLTPSNDDIIQRKAGAWTNRTLAQYLSDQTAGINALIVATKIDDLTQGDDNTDLDSSTSRHGLLRKLDNNAAHFLDGQGNWSTPTGGSAADDESLVLHMRTYA